jgi:hypothetical protein
VKYWFDSSDCISKVDEQWLRFAAENGAPALTPEAVRGSHLSAFISDEGTRELWRRLLDRARQGVAVTLTIRCDAPDRRRTLAVRLRTDRTRVRVTTTLVAQEFRPTIELLRIPRETKGAPLVSCGWCRRFELAPGVWVEVEVLVENLRLFAVTVLPPVSHGICPSCLETASLELRRASPDGGADRASR